MATPGRVIAPDLNLRPSLRPAPVVDVAMVRPVNQEGAGSNLLRIADSLAGLSSSVVRYGASRPKPKEEKDFFPDIAAGWTPEQLMADPRFDVTKDAHRGLWGENFAHEQGKVLQQYVTEARESGEWDPEKEPLDAFLQRKVMGDMEGMPDDLTRAAYGKTIAPYLDKTKTWFEELQKENYDAVNSQEMYKGIVNAAEAPVPGDDNIKPNDKPSNKKLTPEEKAAKAKGRLDEFISLRMLDGKAANNLLMNTIQYYADQGDVEMVTALANMRRGKKNEIDPIADTPEYSGRINEMLSRANAAWEDQNTALSGTFLDTVDAAIDDPNATLNQLTDLFNSEVAQRLWPDPSERAAKLREKLDKQKGAALTRTVDNEKTAEDTAFKNDVWKNFIEMNGGQNYTDRVIKTSDGKDYRIPASKAQDFLDENIRTAYQNATQKGPDAVAAVDRDIARRAGQSSLKVTEWENIFSNVLTGANESMLLEGKVPPNMQRAYDLWKNTRGNEYVRRKNMGEGGDKVDDFFAVTYDLIERRGQSPEAAFAQAFTASKPDRYNPAYQRASEVALGSGSSEFELRERFPGPYIEKIIRRAAVYGASGSASGRSSVEKAIKDFENEMVKIDVGPTSYITLPTNMTEAERDQYGENVTQFIRDQVELHGSKFNPPLDTDQVTVVEVADGKFTLTQDGEWLGAFSARDQDGRSKKLPFFTYEDIQNELNYKTESSRREAAAEVNQTSEFIEKMGEPIDPKGRSAGGALIDTITDMFTSDEPKKDSIFNGYTDNPEVFYGAKTPSQLGELSNYQLRNLRKLAKDGWTDKYGRKQQLPDIGFVNRKKVESVWRDRVAGERRRSGYSKRQIEAAMTRWNVDELDAIERLKKNNAKPDKD
jgi:hypothetical protein